MPSPKTKVPEPMLTVNDFGVALLLLTVPLKVILLFVVVNVVLAVNVAAPV